HQLDGADAGVDHVLQRRLRALIRHAAVAVGNRADLHAVDERIRLRGLQAGRQERTGAAEKRHARYRQGHLRDVASRVFHGILRVYEPEYGWSASSVAASS